MTAANTNAKLPKSDVRGHTCTRGGCGQQLESHETQDDHNLKVHLNDKPYTGDPFKGIPQSDDEPW
jgi:hypothetical protein